MSTPEYEIQNLPTDHLILLKEMNRRRGNKDRVREPLTRMAERLGFEDEYARNLAEDLEATGLIEKMRGETFLRVDHQLVRKYTKRSINSLAGAEVVSGAQRLISNQPLQGPSGLVPFRVLGKDPRPYSSLGASTDAVRRADEGGKVVKEPTLTAHKVANAFRNRVATVEWGALGDTNMQALRGQFARWHREDGVPYETILLAIDIFANNHTRWHHPRSRTPAWRTFVSGRKEWIQRAEERMGATYTGEPASSDLDPEDVERLRAKYSEEE